ncbi:transcription termination/antitermination protein NusG [Mesorhizobium sp. 10J20-29]
MIVSQRQWYVAGVISGQESRAEWHLRRQGFEPFTPRCKKSVRHARKLIVKHSAYFPGYVFIPLDLDKDRWRAINSTIGVRSLIMRGGLPASCPRGMVEQLLELTDSEGLLDLTTRLQEGDYVRVMSGPFAELIGTLQRLDSGGRARVLLNVLADETAVTMSSANLTTCMT